MSALPLPHERESIIGHVDVERRLRSALAEGALSNGWLIAGPKGAGKATLAYRVARAILDPGALADEETLQTPASARVFRLIAARAHPDLFVAERQYDEKAERYATEISVETIRKLNAFLNRTAAGGGWRVAIIDCADELNRNAANALLKSLEEPPPRTALLLVANAPGRLLATIRSRCRRLDLRPVSEPEIVKLLAAELATAQEDAALIAAAAKGLPGYALTLAESDGAEAVSAALAFLRASAGGDDVGRIASALSGRQAEEKRRIFERVVLESLGAAARAIAAGDPVDDPFENADAVALVDARQAIDSLFERARAVNLDRAQVILAAARRIAAAVRPRAA